MISVVTLSWLSIHHWFFQTLGLGQRLWLDSTYAWDNKKRKKQTPQQNSRKGRVLTTGLEFCTQSQLTEFFSYFHLSLSLKTNTCTFPKTLIKAFDLRGLINVCSPSAMFYGKCTAKVFMNLIGHSIQCWTPSILVFDKQAGTYLN